MVGAIDSTRNPVWLVLRLRNETSCLFCYFFALFCLCFPFKPKASGCIVLPASNENTERKSERKTAFSWKMARLLIEEQRHEEANVCLQIFTLAVRNAALISTETHVIFACGNDTRAVHFNFRYYFSCFLDHNPSQHPFRHWTRLKTSNVGSLRSPHQWNRLYNTTDHRYRTPPPSFFYFFFFYSVPILSLVNWIHFYASIFCYEIFAYFDQKLKEAIK